MSSTLTVAAEEVTRYWRRPAPVVFRMQRLGGVLFFFSSRRRHTRLQGGWSSDVCSSDCREDHEADREQADGTQIGAQIAPRRGEGGPVEQRRDEDDEDEVRLERDARQARKQRDRKSVV